MKIIVLILGLAVLPGCATIIHGTHQSVGISSTPPGAHITVDGVTAVTPVVMELKRKENHLVVMHLDGYEDWSGTLTPSVSGWVWGNIVFGGLIGLAVDGISGGIYNLNPESIDGVLRPNVAAR